MTKSVPEQNQQSHQRFANEKWYRNLFTYLLTYVSRTCQEATWRQVSSHSDRMF